MAGRGKTETFDPSELELDEDGEEIIPDNQLSFLGQDEEGEEGEEEEQEEKQEEDRPSEKRRLKPKETQAEEEEEEDDDEEEEEGESESEEEGSEEEGKEEDGGDDPLSQSITITVNEREVETTVGELVKDAQRARAADEKFQQAALQNKRALEVIESVKLDPLATAYHLLAEELGDEPAYERVLGFATGLVGRELEYQQLPAEERERRKSETVLQRKEREIARLRQEQAQREDDQRKALIAESIIRDARELGIEGDPKNPEYVAELSEIAKIYDIAASMGKPVTTKEAVQEYVRREEKKNKARLSGLSADDLRKLGYVRAEDKPRIPKVKAPKKTSTDKARHRRGRKKDPGIYKTFEEARYWSK